MNLFVCNNCGKKIKLNYEEEDPGIPCPRCQEGIFMRQSVVIYDQNSSWSVGRDKSIDNYVKRVMPELIEDLEFMLFKDALQKEAERRLREDDNGEEEFSIR